VPLRQFVGAQPYKNMQQIGTLPGSAIKNTIRSRRHQSVYSALYGKIGLQKLKEICGDKFFVVVPTETNYYKTVTSWDVKPEYKYKGTEAHVFGMLYFEAFYSQIMSDCVATSEEICEYIDWSKSPGFPHTFFGFRSKEELVQVLADTMFNERTDTLPFWNVSGKIEFKNLVDIEENKIRLFQIPAFELLFSQLKFGKRISLRLMEYEWSAYGFNPYGGGFNRLAQKLLKKRYRGCYDVSGWDKFLPLLEDMYSVLKNKCGIPESEIKEFLWTVENTCCFLLKLQNGSVIAKDYGNASGSGCTTRDNIFGHVIIFAAGLYAAYKKKHGESPPFSLVREQLVNLYGDDNVFSVDEPFSLMTDPEFLAEHLGNYGLKLKFFFGGLDADLHTLSFLGASFKKMPSGLWYPLYDVERLATTMVYENDELTLSQHIGKAFTLMVMSRPSDHFETFYSAYSALISSELVRNNLHDPSISSYALVGTPSVFDIDAFFSGNESGNSRFDGLFLSDLFLDM